MSTTCELKKGGIILIFEKKASFCSFAFTCFLSARFLVVFITLFLFSCRSVTRSSSIQEANDRIFEKTVGLDLVEEVLSKNPSWTAPEHFVSWFVSEAKGLNISQFTPDKILVAYQSRSTQNASPSLPRVIVSVDQARFIFAFSGHSKAPSDRSIEMIEANPKTGLYQFASLNFNKTQPQDLKLDRDSSKCQNCHGVPLRPIWDTYPHWPGFFGSLDRDGRDYAEEIQNWSEFLKRVKKPENTEGLERYLPLEKELLSLSPESNRKVREHNSNNPKDLRHLMAKQNTEFGIHIAKHTHQRIAGSKPAQVLSDWAPRLLNRQKPIYETVGWFEWIRGMPLVPEKLDSEDFSEYVQSHLGRFAFEQIEKVEGNEQNFALKIMGKHNEFLGLIHEDKRLRALVSGIPNPYEQQYGVVADLSLSKFILGFLGQMHLRGHDVTRWSTARWYGPKTEEELREILAPVEQGDSRPDLHNSVYLFAAADESVDGLRGNRHLKANEDVWELRYPPEYSTSED